MNIKLLSRILLISLSTIGCKIKIQPDDRRKEPRPRVPECQMDWTYENTFPGDGRFLQPVVRCSVTHAYHDAACKIEFEEYPRDLIHNQDADLVDHYGNVTLEVSTDPDYLPTPAHCDLLNPIPSMRWRAECIVDGRVLSALDTHGYISCGGSPYRE